MDLIILINGINDITIDSITHTLNATNISGSNLTITNINGSPYSPSGATIDNYGDQRILCCSSTTNGITCNDSFKYDYSNNIILLTNPINISISSDTGDSNKALTSNGTSGLKWSSIIDTGMRTCFIETGNQATSTSNNPITLYDTNGDKYNYIPILNNYIMCVFNFNITMSDDILTLEVIDNAANILDTKLVNVKLGINHISVTFGSFSTGDYSINFTIVGSLANPLNSISIDTNSYYSVHFNQLVQ